MLKSIRRSDECRQQFFRNAKNNRRDVERQLYSERKQFSSRVEFDCEELSKENENRNSREKNFETKKTFQVIVSRDRQDIETTSTRKRRE